MKNVKKTIITVFGSSTPDAISDDYQIALELGRAIAAEGWTLCNGGYGGTMEAAAKGATEAGGHTIGVTCAAFGRRGGPNAYIQQEIPTFDLLSRLNTLMRLGTAYVVLPGGTGTLLELALIWETLNKKVLRGRGPIVLLGDHWAPLIEPIQLDTPTAVTPAQVATVAEAIGLLRTSLTPNAAPDTDTAGDESPSSPS